MPLKVDCGDVEFSVNIVFGMTYRLEAKTDDERAQRLGMINKVMDLKPTLEKTVLSQIAEHIGYDQATIDTKLHERDEKIAATQAAEDQGRAEKATLRRGLPPLEPPPPIEHGTLPKALEKPPAE
jgi:hypothetical protein